MDQSNMIGHNLHSVSHSTWNQITNPEFHINPFGYPHSASHFTWNQITNPEFHTHPFAFTPDPYSHFNPFDYTPIGTQSYGSATTFYSNNSHAVPSSHNGSQNVGSHVRVHNQHRPIQEPIEDFMDQIIYTIWDSMGESLEVSNMEAANTYTSLDVFADSVIDWSTPINSNLVPQARYSPYIYEVPNNHLQQESQGPIFWVPYMDWTDQNGATTRFLDDEDMTYEQLLSLAEEMGDISTGLSEDMISKNLKIRTHVSSVNLNEPPSEEEPEICVICQGEYATNEKIGTLQCRHEYHENCIKKWLLQKNVCPICKCTALATEK